MSRIRLLRVFHVDMKPVGERMKMVEGGVSCSLGMQIGYLFGTCLICRYMYRDLLDVMDVGKVIFSFKLLLFNMEHFFI